MDAIPGAQGYRMSNPCVLAVVSLLGSLQVFEETSMQALTAKSWLLTGYLEFLLAKLAAALPPSSTAKPPFTIITPANPSERGCQLSLVFCGGVSGVSGVSGSGGGGLTTLFRRLMERGIVCDKREPDCIRVAPVPLYNSFEDVWRFVDILRDTLSSSSVM